MHGGRIDEIVASQVNGVWYNHHYDAQGNCILLSNVVGGIEQQYDYDAFGFPYFYTATGYKAGNPKTRFLFTGREWIVDMRIYDYRARLYQPELGRFLQPDPMGFAAGDHNLYRYCHNDPVNSSDPTGLREQIAGDIIWAMARYADAANTEQGSFADFTNNAYMGAAGGGGDGGGDGGRRYSFAQVSQSAATPIPNPRTKASAEAVWEGETAVDNTMTREQIIAKWKGDGAVTTAYYPDATITTANGKPNIIQPVMATKHLPNNVSKREYDRFNAIEDKSVKCIQNSVPNVSLRLSQLVNNMNDANAARAAVMQAVAVYMLQESLSCRTTADAMGGNAHP